MAIENLRAGLERIGHRCTVESDGPEAAIARGNHDLVILHSFSEENRGRYAQCLRVVDSIGAPHVVVMHDYWAICHQTNLIRPSMGWKRCRVTEEDPCRPGIRCKHPVKHELLRDDLLRRNVVSFTDRGAEIFRDAGFERVSVVPHGIDLSAFSFQPRTSRADGIRVCFTNAWGKREIKGYLHWDWLRRKSADPSIEFVEALGNMDHGSMPQFLSSCDAMLFLSLWEETFGLVVAESMACGTPVISYPTGVSPDLIDTGVNGILLDASSPRAASAAIEEISAMSVSSREAMRAAARATAESRCTLERMAEGYVDIAKRIVSR